MRYMNSDARKSIPTSADVGSCLYTLYTNTYPDTQMNVCKFISSVSVLEHVYRPIRVPAYA